MVRPVASEQVSVRPPSLVLGSRPVAVEAVAAVAAGAKSLVAVGAVEVLVVAEEVKAVGAL
jgi:hypothetical protein